MIPKNLSLCHPGGGKSCFACCPPIRPAGYEHLQYENIIKRFLRENSRSFNGAEKSIRPITGFSCWALGYLDENYKLVGCLLHPAQNRGIDLRFRIDYGEKCRRETCQEEKIFSRLNGSAGKFWIAMTDDLDSFSYSSRKHNPLFKMMGWGEGLLNMIALEERGKIHDSRAFFEIYPFFETLLIPKANVYLINHVLNKSGIEILKDISFRTAFEQFSSYISDRVSCSNISSKNETRIHQLHIDQSFGDFLRLSSKLSSSNMDNVVILKMIVDNELERFCKGII